MFRTLALAVAVLLTPGLALAAKDPAQARSEALVAAFLKVKPKVPAAQNQKAFQDLDGFLDFDTLVKDATTKLEETRKLTPAQLAEFRAGFRDLLRLIAYPNSGDFFRDAKLKWGAVAKGAKGTTDVPFTATIPAEDVTSNVTLHWKDAGGALKIVDVSFDGESLVQDYSNQFVKVANKDGGAGLLKKLNEKRAEVSKTQGAATPAAGKAEAGTKAAPAKKP